MVSNWVYISILIGLIPNSRFTRPRGLNVLLITVENIPPSWIVWKLITWGISYEWINLVIFWNQSHVGNMRHKIFGIFSSVFKWWLMQSVQNPWAFSFIHNFLIHNSKILRTKSKCNFDNYMIAANLLNHSFSQKMSSKIYWTVTKLELILGQTWDVASLLKCSFR